MGKFFLGLLSIIVSSLTITLVWLLLLPFINEAFPWFVYVYSDIGFFKTFFIVLTITYSIVLVKK